MNTKEQYRLLELTGIAWAALIGAQPTANTDALAVKAVELAKSMMKVEQDLVKKVGTDV